MSDWTRNVTPIDSKKVAAMLAEIDAIRAAGGPDVAQLHDDAHGQNCLGCRIGYALSEHEREGVRTTSEIDRLTAALKVASDRADAAEWQLRKLQGGSYAGMLDRT